MTDLPSGDYDLQKFRFIFHFSDSEIKREREKERNTLREHRSRGRSSIWDEGRATTATTSELRRRGDVTVGLLGFGFYLCIGVFFFFLDKNLRLSVFSVFLSVCSMFGLLLSLICSIGSIGHWGMLSLPPI